MDLLGSESPKRSSVHRVYTEPSLAHRARSRVLYGSSSSSKTQAAAGPSWMQCLLSRLFLLLLAVSIILAADVYLFRLVYMKLLAGHVKVLDTGAHGAAMGSGHVFFGHEQHADVHSVAGHSVTLPGHEHLIVLHTQQQQQQQQPQLPSQHQQQQQEQQQQQQQQQHEMQELHQQQEIAKRLLEQERQAQVRDKERHAKALEQQRQAKVLEQERQAKAREQERQAKAHEQEKQAKTWELERQAKVREQQRQAEVAAAQAAEQQRDPEGDEDEDEQPQYTLGPRTDPVKHVMRSSSTSGGAGSSAGSSSGSAGRGGSSRAGAASSVAISSGSSSGRGGIIASASTSRGSASSSSSSSSNTKGVIATSYTATAKHQQQQQQPPEPDPEPAPKPARLFASLRDMQASEYRANAAMGSSTMGAATLGTGAAMGTGTMSSATNKDGRYPGLPSDFDPEAYIDYNPDLANGWKQVSNSSTDLHAMARDHYVKYGHREPRVYKRFPLAMRYTACGGLMNQHYSHVAALTIAMQIGADVILPYALRRDSFGKYFNPDPSKNRVLWTPAPFSTLWDIVHIEHYFSSKGLGVSFAPANAPVPNLLWPQQAFQQYAMPGFSPDQFVYVSNVYLASKPIGQLVKEILGKTAYRAGVLAESLDMYAKRYPAIILELPCTLFGITTPQLPTASLVAQNFRFSPAVQSLANKVVYMMGQEYGAVVPYNGIHLRIEKDAMDWMAIMGGRAHFWQLYIREVMKAGFSHKVPVYMAAGILSYNDREQMGEATSKLGAHARDVVFKEKYLTRTDMEGLHPEQLALVDFLVLAQCRHFVGISVSTFSVFIREYRYLRGIAPKNTTWLVDGTVVGTEALFNRAAVFY